MRVMVEVVVVAVVVVGEGSGSGRGDTSLNGFTTTAVTPKWPLLL